MSDASSPPDATEYRATLNLPKTGFPMRGNLPKREPEWIREWEDRGLYRRMLDARRDAPSFVLHDGPPYANGNIHIGHTLNKVLKDIVVKFRSMAGWRAPYVPGWDCHGLPIELQVERTLGSKNAIGKAEFRGHCRDYAARFVSIQRDEFRRLGVLGDWDRPYLTMDPSYEANEVRALGRFFEADAIYRRRKPVLWCASCRTALAEAEVEYEDRASPSIYVAFPLPEPLPPVLDSLAGREVAIAIWTTTPWTLPANLAIALHPDFDYVAIELGNRVVLVAEGLSESFRQAVGAPDAATLLRVPGRDLENVRARHPWIDRDSVVVLGEHVTLEAGTGCVHTAPGHGHDDYVVGLRYGLEPYAPVDAEGRFTSDVEDLAGTFVFDADPEIVAKLRADGHLLHGESFQHSYPSCWRCKNPVIFRATDQWFVSMDALDLRRRTLEAIDEVEWIPGWGRERIRGMMESRPDWCISRQRSWGVPIVAFHCESCEGVLATRELAEHAALIFERDGSDAWFTDPVSAFLPAETRCDGCGGRDLRKEQDILDVWFDSGVSHVSVLSERSELTWPADLYLEGSDQHRGWFHTSLLTSLVLGDRAPYESVLTHGFTVDQDGRKMSKSSGNVVAPQEVIEKYGAEILRLWVAAEDYRDDIRISEEIVKRMVESYRRVRNTFRFLLANLSDFDPSVDRVVISDLPEVDRWILDRSDRFVERCRQGYLDYEFHVVHHALNNFCSVDLSSLYLDIAKDRLYCSRTEAVERRSAQTALWTVARSLIPLTAPILSFTSEEAWSHFPADAASTESVFLVDFPEPSLELRDDALAATFDRLLEVRSTVMRAIEEQRTAGALGHSLEAAVFLHADDTDGLRGVLERPDLAEVLIVSEVHVNGSAEGLSETEVPGLRVGVQRASGAKCARCWCYRSSVGDDGSHPELCDRCVSVITGS